jgi:hypothetical protein
LSEEIRDSIERRVNEIEQRRVFEELEALIQNLPRMPRGSITRYVREDRDSN